MLQNGDECHSMRDKSDVFASLSVH